LPTIPPSPVRCPFRWIRPPHIATQAALVSLDSPQHVPLRGFDIDRTFHPLPLTCPLPLSDTHRWTPTSRPFTDTSVRARLAATHAPADNPAHRRLYSSLTASTLSCTYPTIIMASSTTASQAELNANQVPLQWRDNCSAWVLVSHWICGMGAASCFAEIRSGGVAFRTVGR